MCWMSKWLLHCRLILTSMGGHLLSPNLIWETYIAMFHCNFTACEWKLNSYIHCMAANMGILLAADASCVPQSFFCRLLILMLPLVLPLYIIKKIRSEKEKQYWWQLVCFRSVSPDPSLRDSLHWMLIINRHRVLLAEKGGFTSKSNKRKEATWNTTALNESQQQ